MDHLHIMCVELFQVPLYTFNCAFNLFKLRAHISKIIHINYINFRTSSHSESMYVPYCSSTTAVFHNCTSPEVNVVNAYYFRNVSF